MLPAAISGSSRLPPGPRDILAAFSPAVAETPSMYAAAWSATDWSAACFARSCCTRTTAAAPATTRSAARATIVRFEIEPTTCVAPEATRSWSPSKLIPYMLGRAIEDRARNVSLVPRKATGEARTPDLRFTKPPLYRLSYGGNAQTNHAVGKNASTENRVQQSTRILL